VVRATGVLTLVLIASAALVAGCGNSRTTVPSLTQPARPNGFRQLIYPDAAVEFDVPRDWLVSASTRRLPLVATVTSGEATVALWRYLTPRPAPGTQSGSVAARLSAARAALIASAKARDPRLQVLHTRTETLLGLPAVVVRATERIAGSLRRVRSIHIFAPGSELVIEEYAPPDMFHAIDQAVFSKLDRSLSLIGAHRA
jgi:hypothetical protein